MEFHSCLRSSDKLDTFNKKTHKNSLFADHLHIEQGVALTGRNYTGPPLSITDDDRRRTTTTTDAGEYHYHTVTLYGGLAAAMP